MTLLKKGLILATIPLVLELVLVSSLAYLYGELEREALLADKAARKLDIVNGITRETFLVMRRIKFIDLEQTGKFKADYHKELSVALKELDELLVLAKDNAGQLRLAQQFKDGLTAIDRDTQLACLAFKRGDMQSYEKLKRQAAQRSRTLIDAEFVSMAKDEQEIQDRIERQENDRRGQIKMVLLAIVPASIALSIALAFYVSKSLTRRVLILEENSARLARGESLTDPISGCDEVNSVDNAIRKMAASLTEAAARERALIDNCRAVLCSIDRAGRFTSINKAASQVLGYSADQLLGLHLVDLLSVAHRQQASEKIQAVVTEHRPKIFETRMNAKNGRNVDVSVSADWSESTESVVCVVHDITERKESERTRRQFTDLLTIGLRNPLSTIRRIYDRLENDIADGAISAEAAPFMSRAKQSITRMLALTNDLIDLEQLKSGNLQIAKSEVPVAQLFDHCLSLVSGLAKEKSLKIEATPTDLIVFADADRLLQILVNLTSNAVKFSPSGGVVSLVAASGEDTLCLKVIDRGRGIPTHLQDAIFDRFQQVRADDSTIGGSGLGLSICRALVELHGGTISVESEEGQGSTFIVALPNFSEESFERVARVRDEGRQKEQ